MITDLNQSFSSFAQEGGAKKEECQKNVKKI